MKYNFLGKSDLKVSNYCLGTMTYGEQTSERMLICKWIKLLMQE